MDQLMVTLVIQCKAYYIKTHSHNFIGSQETVEPCTKSCCLLYINTIDIMFKIT